MTYILFTMQFKALDSMALRITENKVYILDQTALPQTENWIEVLDPNHMIELIKTLAVRGAPLIGVAAAISLAHFAVFGKNGNTSLDEILEAARNLRKARPTAINLAAAIDRIINHPKMKEKNFKNFILNESIEIFEEDARHCEEMSSRAAEYIKDGDHILTHCNAGALVTTGIGTALGAIVKATEQGKKIHVYVDETRPLLQGARLTAWEMKKRNIPHTLICDNMSGLLMSKGKISKIFVGADRIARNGDFANKIGTHNLAVLSNYYKVPMYVVAPYTTLDMNCANGSEIPIEERDAEEVRAGKSYAGCPVYNPAFDVTKRELITAIILNDRIM